MLPRTGLGHSELIRSIGPSLRHSGQRKYKIDIKLFCQTTQKKLRWRSIIILASRMSLKMVGTTQILAKLANMSCGVSASQCPKGCFLKSKLGSVLSEIRSQWCSLQNQEEKRWKTYYRYTNTFHPIKTLSLTPA